MKRFYTSDIHFGQKSLLATGRFKERPFQTLEEMNEEIIRRWNKKVTNNDHVYILGDIGKRGFANMHPELVSQLKGNKHLIVGNHDDVSDQRIRQLFVEICDMKEVKDGKSTVILCHYPIMMWKGQHAGNILLYGHTHDTEDEKLFQEYLNNYRKARDIKCQAFNVGMCHWNYEPVTLAEITKNGELN